MKTREIDRYFYGIQTQDGAGVKLRRCFGASDIPDYDPFLMMDFFDSSNPDDYIKGFPWHPHRGIETITYLIHGQIDHEDSLGNKDSIMDGDCQWMSAGSGILHQEMPQKADRMLGVQIWLNLAQENKMEDPKYRDIKKDMIPIYEGEGYKVHIIAGSYGDLEGPITDEGRKPSFFDVDMDPNSEFIFDLDKNLSSFAFSVDGEVNFENNGEKFVGSATGVMYKKGDRIRVRTGDRPGRFFLLAGAPLNEKVAWGGPVVMNTKEELDLAFRELNEGTFIKVKNLTME